MTGSAHFCPRAIHSHHVLYGNVRLDRVRRREDIPAVSAQDTGQAQGLRPDLFGRTLRQEFLRVNTAIKREAVAELALQVIRFHSGSARLDRVEYLHARHQQSGDQIADRAA